MVYGQQLAEAGKWLLGTAAAYGALPLAARQWPIAREKSTCGVATAQDNVWQVVSAARRIAWAKHLANKRVQREAALLPAQPQKKRRRGVAESRAVVEGVNAAFG